MLQYLLSSWLSSPWHLFTLREYLERLQLLKTPEERQRILEGVPEIHADPNINPSHGSDEDEGETEDKRQGPFPFFFVAFQIYPSNLY
ncbi:hypothetical protein NC652_023882 [Populus alba x Populus x berolinensis]|nr:hypothetical protein NC652_023882 [Populus alba x Populus x berolinensis]